MSLDLQKRLAQVRGGNVSGFFEHSSRKTLEREFKNFPNYTVGTYLDEDVEMRVIHDKTANDYTKQFSEQRTFLFLPDTKVDIGGIVGVQNHQWIVFDSKENDLFPTYFAIKANNTIKIKISDGERVPTGYNSIGQPIYDNSIPVEPIYLEEPCYATTNARFNVYTEFNAKVNLPQGRLFIILPYRPDKKLSDGMEFEMFGDRYRIINIDISSVFDDKGITELFVEKIQKQDDN